jgi:hypothetical protein
MGNVLKREKREQVIALGRLGWSLRRIEEPRGVRRETAGEYLRRAGVAIRPVGSWGEKSLAKAATQVIAGSGEEGANPAIVMKRQRRSSPISPAMNQLLPDEQTKFRIDSVSTQRGQSLDLTCTARFAFRLVPGRVRTR